MMMIMEEARGKKESAFDKSKADIACSNLNYE
jgi:hypothetical protein